MTDYETATIAYRAASLAHQNAGVWVAVGQLAATVIVGGAQCALIWHGIRMMRRAADTRDRGLENQRHADERRHAEAMAAIDKRHAEAMAAIDKRHAEAGTRHAEATAALDKRHAEAGTRHAEAMAALNELIAGSREQGAALQTATAALRTLVERTVPREHG